MHTPLLNPVPTHKNILGPKGSDFLLKTQSLLLLRGSLHVWKIDFFSLAVPADQIKTVKGITDILSPSFRMINRGKSQE